MVYHLSIHRDRGARLTNREIRFEVHILNFSFATLLGTVWTNIDRPLLFLFDCPLSVLFDHQQLVLWTVHLSSIDRPLIFKTVRFRLDRSLSGSLTFPTLIRSLSARLGNFTKNLYAFGILWNPGILNVKSVTYDKVHRMDLWSASIKLKIGLSVVQFTPKSMY